MSFMFEQLNVYQKAINLAETITNATEAIARGNYYLTDQLNRAVLSISTNLAEGNGRWHEKDRKQFFYIARGSAQECVPIIELCKRKN
ncbi:MAG: four helix bundle protein [candidate division FCPU426 bacterium]